MLAHPANSSVLLGPDAPLMGVLSAYSGGRDRGDAEAGIKMGADSGLRRRSERFAEVSSEPTARLENRAKLAEMARYCTELY